VQPFAVCPGAVVRGPDDAAMASAQRRAQCRPGFACVGLLVGFSRAERYTPSPHRAPARVRALRDRRLVEGQGASTAPRP